MLDFCSIFTRSFETMCETFISDDSYDFFRCRYHLDQPTFFYFSLTLHNCCHYYRRRRRHHTNTHIAMSLNTASFRRTILAKYPIKRTLLYHIQCI